MADVAERTTGLGIDGDDFGIRRGENPYSVIGNVVVVDNLPEVRNKSEKLECLVRKIYSKRGTIRENGFWMPLHPRTKRTLGFCFIVYNTPQEAWAAKEKTQNYKLDTSRRLSVSLFVDIEKYLMVPDGRRPPETKNFVPGQNLQKWLIGDEARDQFLIRSCADTEVVWNDARHLKPIPVYKRSFWTDSFVQWSPLGTYLATVHRQGAAVWGGYNTFDCLVRFAHPQVELIDFSPGERFLVTCSNLGDIHSFAVNIFDVSTGKVMKNFKGSSAHEFAVGVSGISWPVFRWAGGSRDKYFASIGKNVISVYRTDTFTLVDEKSIEIENVVDFCWSPADPIIAFFVPELDGGNQPARVSLVKIPGKEELRQKNLFDVSDCKMYWQNNGDYLAVQVDRYKKNEEGTHAGFELFRMKEPDIPIDVLELENNNKIVAFAWEPNGHRFAVLHGDSPRPDISFYAMHPGGVTKLATLKGKKARALKWSPAGRFILLAGLRGFNGHVEFYNVDELKTMATVEHSMATEAEWDPTGRYVATSVISTHAKEKGYRIWSSDGKLLYGVPNNYFFQFLWRPIRVSILSPENVDEFATNLMSRLSSER